MLADVTDEVDERIVLHPVVVVDKLGAVWRIGVKIQETAELCLQTLDIVTEGILVQKIALGRFHRRVANHPRSPADKGERFMSTSLEMLEYHYTYKVTNMKGVGRRVNAYIGSLRAFHKFFFGSGHNILDHAPPSEFFYKVFHNLQI